MKKILLALAAIVVVLSLAGCGNDEKKDKSTESTTSLNDSTLDGSTESNEDYGDISPEIKKEIDDYESLCSKYYTLLTENIDADEERRQEIIIELYDLRYDREKAAMAITDLDKTTDELQYWIDVEDSWEEKIGQAESDFWTP
ncbi:MAG: hypothetical protein HDT39_15970 [Lachnospiraceae bacterium]|nr:hypothetical protein [Lachnospiraceae bacterium]